MSSEPLTLRRVAEIVNGTVDGKESVVIESLAAIDQAGPGQLTFADARHAGQLSAARAEAALVERDGPRTGEMPVVRVDDVGEAIARLLEHLAGAEDLPDVGIHPTATIDPGATIGQSVAIGAGVVVRAGATVGEGCVLCAGAVVGRDVAIGEDTVLFEGVVVRAASEIGRRVRIGPNSVIGFEGFGYRMVDGTARRIPHVGNVVIEDDVEIGASTCVDRAKFGSTRIGAGTKIDNLVMIAHNCQIGPGSLLVAQVGVAGSTRLGRHVVLGGHAGVRDNITLGDGVQVASYSGVSSDVPSGEQVAGTPAQPKREAFRIFQAWRRLPDLLKRVKKLESRIETLESPKDH